MKRNLLLSIVAATVGAGAMPAQSPGNAPVAAPNSPAPTVQTTPAPAPAPAVVQAPNPDTAASAQTRVTQIVYTPQLPSAADLTNAAAGQNLTVERIVQTSNQVIAFYRNASGQAVSVAYQSLPPSGTPTTAPGLAVVVTSPPRTVVYESAPRVIYYDQPAYYYPGVWYPPVSFNFGFGFRSFHGGYGHGGSRHWR